METRHGHSDGMSFSAGATAIARKAPTKKGVTKMNVSKQKQKNRKAVKRSKRTSGTGMKFMPGGSED